MADMVVEDPADSLSLGTLRWREARVTVEGRVARRPKGEPEK